MDKLPLSCEQGKVCLVNGPARALSLCVIGEDQAPEAVCHRIAVSQYVSWTQTKFGAIIRQYKDHTVRPVASSQQSTKGLYSRHNAVMAKESHK